MSRDALSWDPRDPREDRTRRATRPFQPRPAETMDRASGPPDDRDRSEPPQVREQHAPDPDRDDRLQACYVRDRAYLLRDSELRSLKEVGMFRVVAAADLAKHAYRGNSERMEKDLRRLGRNGLVNERTLPISRKRSLRVVALTKAGHRLLKATNQVPEDQPLYHGLRKPREAEHDADLYRLYQKEAARIERAGGRVRRVSLDYEIKKHLNRDLALLGENRDDHDRKEEIAERHGLRVVNGKIPVPDLRLEYETAELEVKRVDLELATREYRPQAVAEKAAAGFSLYSRPQDAARLRRILDESELTAGIFSL